MDRETKPAMSSFLYRPRATLSSVAAGILVLYTCAEAQTVADPDRESAALVSLEKITRPLGHKIARFKGPICLKVVAEDKSFAAAVEDRFAEETRRLGLGVNRAVCTPNVEIAISSDHQRFLQRFLGLYGQLTDDALSKRALASIRENKIIVWSLGPTSESPPASRHYESIRIAHHEFRDVDAAAGEASLIGHSGNSNRQAALLIVDSSMIDGRTASQIADYAAMRLLGQTTDALPEVQSILRLFRPERPVPDGFTAFDRVYLDQLYAGPADPPVSDFIRNVHPAAQKAAEPLMQARRNPSRTNRGDDEALEASLEAAGPVTADTVTTSLEQHEPDQSPHSATADWATDIVVVGRKEGPAMWRVRRGNSAITILGTVAPLPQKVEWLDWRVKMAIRRSRLMLINSEPEANLIWMRDWSPIDAASMHQPKKRTIADDVGPEVERRLATLAVVAGQNAERYSSLRPGAAALLLNADWRDHTGYSNTSLSTSLAAYALRNHVSVEFIRQISLLPTLDEFPGMATSSQISCLVRIMTGIENEHAMVDLQARDWAVGDIGDLRRHYISPVNCAAETRQDDHRRQSAIATWTGSLLKALDRNGSRTFAMIDLSSLLRQDGVLMQLRQAGATIDVPPDEAE
ncbi:TraB/GumN family protein [Novosphingobium sp.]|uniref:TraB/GumN family protein n=1 Tax=Novosphingobium sp. TaxID=1874826 RepID=UPI0031D68FCB